MAAPNPVTDFATVGVESNQTVFFIALKNPIAIFIPPALQKLFSLASDRNFLPQDFLQT